jgi:integrase
VARQLGVSRTYVTLLIQGKRKPSQKLVDKLTQLMFTANLDKNQQMKGPLAQLAEQLTLNQPVGGSSPPRLTTAVLNVKANQLVSTSANFLFEEFIKSRRQGTSPQTIRFYKICLKPFLEKYPLTSQGINAFLSSLKCGNAKHAYYRAIRALCNWAVKEGHITQNPLAKVDVPKVTKRILPSLTSEQVEYVIQQAETLRDKTMVSLFADSGMRLSELASIEPSHINWDTCTITIWGKGGKQRKAPFTDRTARLPKEYLAQNGTGENIWHLNTWGIISVLRRLRYKTGLPCNPHTFRRTFASNLHRAGLDIEHIMRLGGWESLDMVLRYTRSVKFEESLRLYREIKG